MGNVPLKYVTITMIFGVNQKLPRVQDNIAAISWENNNLINL